MKRLVRLCALGALSLACARTGRHGPPDAPAAGGASGVDASGGMAGSDSSACALPPPGLIRLSFPELVASVDGLLGSEPATTLARELQIDATERDFPPLRDGREGESISDARLLEADRLAQTASAYAGQHYAELTRCEPRDYDCVTRFVAAFAERAFRRPVSPSEGFALQSVVKRAQELQASAEQAAEYGVYAALSSPHFLYRTELGDESADAELRLSGYELGSQLAFFLTGAPPDAELLAAAAAGGLGVAEQLEQHAARLLDLPASHRHLEQALASHLGVPRVRSVVLDDVQGWSAQTVVAAEAELRSLLGRTLWSEPLGALLTSRAARVDASLARIYGLDFPPPGAAADPQGFADVELPLGRAGLLTRSGTAALTSRPDGPSIVQRGLWVSEVLLCDTQPAETDVDARLAAPASGSRRERAEQRLQNPSCRDCHLNIDPYGLALDDLDAVGHFRSEDQAGDPIDASATLPALAGGAKVHSSLELSSALPSGALALCLSQRFLDYALALAARAERRPGCVARELERARSASAKLAHFSDILRQIVTSRAFAYRQR